MPDRIGPILTPRVESSIYFQLAVWSTKRAATEWAQANGWKPRDVFRIKAGSQNMSFTQWILRDAAGMALTESGFRAQEARRAPAPYRILCHVTGETTPFQHYDDMVDAFNLGMETSVTTHALQLWDTSAAPARYRDIQDTDDETTLTGVLQ